MQERKWYKWPEGWFTDPYSPKLMPWYVILRRLVVAPIQLTGILITFVGTVLGYGFKDGIDFIDRAL